jgi:hypothetical protein
MDTPTRNKVEMATRVRDFGRDHPDPTPRGTEAQATLEARLTRIDTLATQHKVGRDAARAARDTKRRIRRDIREKPLHQLTRIAGAVLAEQPELHLRLELPKASVSARDFLTAARAMAAVATGQKELFLSFGMPATFLDDLAGALAQYEQAVTAVTASTASHIGARADLEAVTEEIMQVVRTIDALNHLRFADQPELLTAWEGIRNVPWAHSAPAPAPAPTATPPAGEARPNA